MNIAFQIGDKQQIRINGMIIFLKIRLHTVADRYRKIGLYRTIQMISHFNPASHRLKRTIQGVIRFTGKEHGRTRHHITKTLA